jgi:hypothetical protein
MHMPESDLKLVLQKIRKVFPNQPEDEILAQLQGCCVDRCQVDRIRIFLAILKLCEEEGRIDPEHFIEAAKKDYRDVLYWAESPHEARSPTWNEKDAEKIRQTRKLDSAQYNDWLKKK